jgi:hypothetical protein
VKLLDAIREADELTCRRLLEQELSGRKRSQFIKRIHGRLNRVRAMRERLELTKPEDLT